MKFLVSLLAALASELPLSVVLSLLLLALLCMSLLLLIVALRPAAMRRALRQVGRLQWVWYGSCGYQCQCRYRHLYQDR